MIYQWQEGDCEVVSTDILYFFLAACDCIIQEEEKFIFTRSTENVVLRAEYHKKSLGL